MGDRRSLWLGPRPFALWRGRCEFFAITEAWNGEVFASRLGASGSMVVFGGGFVGFMLGSEFTVRQTARFMALALMGNLIGGSIFVALLN